MASYISVPRDLSKVKTKVFMNLTKRQILCFGAGALIGVPVFFLLKSSGNLSLAALGMMAVMLPLFFLAMYEKGPVSRWKWWQSTSMRQSSRGRKRGLTKQKITMHCWCSRQMWKWR